MYLVFSPWAFCLKTRTFRIATEQRSCSQIPSTNYLLFAHFRLLSSGGLSQRTQDEKKILFVRNISSGISFLPMESLDQQFRQQKENYEHMTEGELCALAERAYDLTDIAREALQAVIMEKGVDILLKMDPLAPPLRPEDEDLVVFRWEMNIEDAGRTMKTLAAAGIPSFLSLEVRADDVIRAKAALDRACEEDVKEDGKDDPNETECAILCPKCHSAKVILQGRTATLEASPYGVKFQWSCDSCGHQWMDNGWVQEVPGGQSWPGEEFPSSSFFPLLKSRTRNDGQP